MDYFQGVVTEYLRAKRSVFVNTECLLQLDEVASKDRHWYCDIVAADFSVSCVYLCEVTYSTTMHTLIGRLAAWQAHWPELASAVRRQCAIPDSWSIAPWVFIPAGQEELFKLRCSALKLSPEGVTTMPPPRITYLEATLPWHYRTTWDRKKDHISGMPDPVA